MNSLDHINAISQEMFGKQSYTLEVQQLHVVIEIFNQHRAEGRFPNVI